MRRGYGIVIMWGIGGFLLAATGQDVFGKTPLPALSTWAFVAVGLVCTALWACPWCLWLRPASAAVVSFAFGLRAVLWLWVWKWPRPGVEARLYSVILFGLLALHMAFTWHRTLPGPPLARAKITRLTDGGR